MCNFCPKEVVLCFRWLPVCQLLFMLRAVSLSRLGNENIRSLEQIKQMAANASYNNCDANTLRSPSNSLVNKMRSVANSCLSAENCSGSFSTILCLSCHFIIVIVIIQDCNNSANHRIAPRCPRFAIFIFLFSTYTMVICISIEADMQSIQTFFCR